jgi:hypothetical protein
MSSTTPAGRSLAARAYLWRGEEPVLPPGFSLYTAGDERHFFAARSGAPSAEDRNGLEIRASSPRLEEEGTADKK